MRNTVLTVISGSLLFLASTQTASSEQAAACEMGDLDFDITKTATWRIAPGEKFQLLARLEEPHLYEVCRGAALGNAPLRLVTDLGVNVSTQLHRQSCSLVFSKLIGVLAPKETGATALVAGTYRRIGEKVQTVFSDKYQLQAQGSFVSSNENTFALSAVTAGKPGQTTTPKFIYRVCQDGSASTQPSPKDHLRGATVWVDGTPLSRFPIDQQPALFGKGACVDFSGGNVNLKLTRESPTQVTYLACGKVAFGEDK